MKKMQFVMILAVIMIFGAACLVHASTAEEAKALVEKAAAYVKANGKEKAVAEFNNPNGQFKKGELYIFGNNFEGICQAHGGNVKLVGQNHIGLKDANDKLFMKEMIEVTKTKGSGWVNYSWTNPVTKKVQPKTAWVQRVEGSDWFIGCGVYK